MLPLLSSCSACLSGSVCLFSSVFLAFLPFISYLLACFLSFFSFSTCFFLASHSRTLFSYFSPSLFVCLLTLSFSLLSLSLSLSPSHHACCSASIPSQNSSKFRVRGPNREQHAEAPGRRVYTKAVRLLCGTSRLLIASFGTRCEIQSSCNKSLGRGEKESGIEMRVQLKLSCLI